MNQAQPATWGIPTDGRIPALSLRMPWPFAISDLGKRIENRLAWSSCKYRGPLLLHAAAWPASSAPDDMLQLQRDLVILVDKAEAIRSKDPQRSSFVSHVRKHLEADPIKSIDDPFYQNVLQPRGGVFGICELVDVIPGIVVFHGMLASGAVAPEQKAWYMGGFALLLGSFRKLPFVPCGGAPKFFGVHPSAYQLINLSQS